MWWIREQMEALRLRMDRERRARRSGSEELAAIARDQAELGRWVTVVTTMLIEKGVLSADELRARIEAARPADEPGPFADLNRPTDESGQ